MPSVRVTAPAAVNLYAGPSDPRIASTAATQTANTAYISAFQVNVAMTVSSAVWAVGTSSGSAQIGIYDASGNLLASTAATAVTGAAGKVVWPLSAAVTLYPGVKYYAAFVADNNTVTVQGISPGQGALMPDLALGYTVATSFPLPNPITFGSSNLGRAILVFFR